MVAAECEKLGAKVEIVARRPSSETHCDAIVDAAVKRFRRLDILVAASGQNKVSKIVDQKPEDFLDVMDANVTQSWLIARAAGRQMLKQGQGGKVILMSSARGLLGHPAGYTAYCASKSAVDGITKALGCEWGEAGITVNALGPTVFRSPLTQWMFEDTERSRDVRKSFLTRVPKGRLGEPSDLAGPLLFLASKASDSTPATFSTPTAATRRGEGAGQTRALPSLAPVSWATASRRSLRSPVTMCASTIPHGGDLDSATLAHPGQSRGAWRDDPSAIERSIPRCEPRCRGARCGLRRRGGARRDLALKQKMFVRDRAACAGASHFGQQYIRDPDHRHYGGVARPRPRCWDPLVESTLSRALGRGDRHAMDCAGSD